MSPTCSVAEDGQQLPSVINENNQHTISTRNSGNEKGASSLTGNPHSYPELRIDGLAAAAWSYQGEQLDHEESAQHDSSTTAVIPVPIPPPSLPLIASQTALLVVDVQPQYWSQCPAVRKDFPDFPDRIQQLIRTCRDRHINSILWVYADYRFDSSPWLKQFHRLHQGNIPSEVHFDDKTGWEDFAKPQPLEPMIAKKSWSSTSHTRLLDLLQKSGVDTVLVCGLITSVCVQHSAFGVFEAGYRTVLVTDACADRGRERHKAALALYGDYMYELKTVQQVQDELQMATMTTTTATMIPEKEEGEEMMSSSSVATTLTVEDQTDDSADEYDDDESSTAALLSKSSTTSSLLRKRLKVSSLQEEEENNKGQKLLLHPDGFYLGVA
jgi:nicotinamidase-related amidase